MAKTNVNLSDTVTNWVTKTNQLSNTIGDLTNLNTSQDSDIVGAINELKVAVDKTDSADIITTAKGITSGYIPLGAVLISNKLSTFTLRPNSTILFIKILIWLGSSNFDPVIHTSS